MELAVGILALLCLCLITSNYYFYQKYTAAKKAPAHSISAEEILHDLTAHGVALVKVERIDPLDVMLRRRD